MIRKDYKITGNTNWKIISIMLMEQENIYARSVARLPTELLFLTHSLNF